MIITVSSICLSIYTYMYSDCLGCAVLLCLVVCSTLLASFFLPSHLSLKHVHMYFAAHRTTTLYNL